MERVRILLRTRNDVYPTTPARSIPSTPAGPAPGRRLRCPNCGGSGRVRVGQACPACEGRGKIATDSYTGRVTGSEERRAGAMTAQQIEAELARIERSFVLSEGRIDPDEAYGWERARERRDAGASYQELERVLQLLRARHQLYWEFIVWIYASGLDVELTPAAHAVEDDVVAWIAERMQGAIRVPARQHKELKERARQEILALVDEGLEPDAIAERLGLSRRWVRRVLDVRKSKTLVL